MPGDFVGRIANRVLQTGNALRESGVQAVDALWYVTIYAGSALYRIAQAEREEGYARLWQHQSGGFVGA